MAGRGREWWNAAEFLCSCEAQTGTYAATWQKCQLWLYHCYVTKRKGTSAPVFLDTQYYAQAIYFMHGVLISVMLLKLNLGNVIASTGQRKKI